MRHRLLRPCLALWLTAALTACGGGSGGSVPTDPKQTPAPTAAPTPLGTVLAKVTDTSGAPFADASVSLLAKGGDTFTAVTNAAGEVRFTNVPAVKATLRAEGWGYYPSSSQDVTVVAQSEVGTTFRLEPRDPTTAVVLGSRVVSKGTDGKALEFEIDVGVLDPSGQPLTNLADVAFSVPELSCDWFTCGVGPGGTSTVAGYSGADRPTSFGLVPAGNRSPAAVGLLVDQGLPVVSGPSEPARSAALVEFLTALGGNDSALIAEFRGIDGTESAFDFAPSGGFVSDGRLLQGIAQGLPGRVDGRYSDPVAGIERMLTHLQQQSAAQLRALVTLTSSNIWCRGDGSPPYSFACNRLVDLSRVAGIPITTMASGGASNIGATEVALRSGGAAFVIDFPAQYRTSMRGLLSVLGGEIPFYRMRFVMEVNGYSKSDALTAGNTLYLRVWIKLSPRDCLVLPIPLTM